MQCNFCNKICKNNNSLRNHERLCKDNPNRQILVSNFIKYNVKRRELNIKGSNQYTKAAELGLPKPIISTETRLKLSQANKRRPPMSLEDRARKSEIMRRVVKDNPESYSKNNVSGRVKGVDYKGVRLKGSWELLVAQWLDRHSINWQYETRGFEYQWQGTRMYYPDFYLPEFDIYLEVKGYETLRDTEKWKVVPNLVVFKQKQIQDIKENKALVSALTHNQ